MSKQFIGRKGGFVHFLQLEVLGRHESCFFASVGKTAGFLNYQQDASFLKGE